jgi:hypothetical protein
VISIQYEELKERVTMGEEFQFYYQNESYWISKNQRGFYLTRVSDSYSQSFLTADDLFKDATIDGKSIHNLWDEIDI